MTLPRGQFTIGQLAREAQIPATTVRYYERIGLLVPDDRSQGNYRLYDRASLGRLQFIRAAKSIGFALDDVRALLGTRDGKPPRCSAVQRLIERRLTDIGERLRNLRHVQRVLKAAMTKCKKNARTGCCHVIESLRSRS